MAPSLLAVVALLALPSTFLHPAASLCAPRTDPFHASFGDGHNPPPSVPPVTSPSPSPRASPSPPASPSPSPPPPSGVPHDNGISSASQANVDSYKSDGPLKKICSTTIYPDQCFSDVRSAVSGLDDVDPRTVLDKMIGLIVVNVRAVKKKADGLPAELKVESTAPAPPTDDPDRAGNPNPLNRCIRELGDALSSAESAQLYLQEGSSPGRVRSYLDAFTNSITECTEAATPVRDDAGKIYRTVQNGRKIFDSMHPEGSHDALFPEQNVPGKNV